MRLKNAGSLFVGSSEPESGSRQKILAGPDSIPIFLTPADSRFLLRIHCAVCIYLVLTHAYISNAKKGVRTPDSIPIFPDTDFGRM
jgi:hypothetical protein